MNNQDPFLSSREWRVLRMQALERDGAKCCCCGRTANDGVTINVDHIKPRIRYPELALTLENLQVLCNECNHGKGNRYETDWRTAIDQSLEQRRYPGGTDEEITRLAQLKQVRRLIERERLYETFKKQCSPEELEKRMAEFDYIKWE